MDKALVAERKQLSGTIKIIRDYTENMDKHKPYPDVHPYSVGYDADERSNLRLKKERNARFEEKIGRIRSTIDNPYFARMDLMLTEKEYRDSLCMYIGKKGVKINNKDLIYDWRSPVGEKYYVKDAIEFKHNEFTYSLMLRRALKIRDGKLLSYNDEYIWGAEIFKEGITDPFLVEILREKRDEHRLTDIIKTIQHNQNDIISVSGAQSFIVQGCAGSGKTMILLHRLSKLIYRNPKTDFSKIKIITPTQNFNMHINDLYTELELDRIQYLTTEEYYIQLIKKYRSNWRSTSLLIEDSLPNTLIREVYSDKFYLACKHDFYNAIDAMYEQIDIDGLNEICASHNLFNRFVVRETPAETLLGLTNFVRNIIDGNTAYKNELRKAKKVFSRFPEVLNDFTILDETLNSVQPIDDWIGRVFSLSPDKGKKSIEELNEHLQEQLLNCQTRIHKNEVNREGTAEQLNAAILRQADLHLFEEEATRRRIKEEHNAVKEKAEYAKELETLSVFQLLKRSHIKNELNALNTTLNGTLTTIDTTISDCHSEMAKLEKDIATKKEYIQELDSESKQLNNLIIVTERARYHVEKLIKISNMRGIDFFHNYIVSKAYPDRILSKESLGHIEHIENMIPQYTADKLFQSTIYQNLKKAYSDNDASLPVKIEVYRHNLYLWLLFYGMWAGIVPNNDRFLSIDEAQDFSPNEINVMRLVNGEDLILNLYGDINQMSNPKGIMDWNELRDIQHTFVLNENYRNSIEITTYCNDTIGENAVPIGLSGEPVQILSIDELIEKIDNYNKKPNGKRVAVILSKDNPDLIDLCIRHNCVRGTIVENRIAIFSVSEVKGLEFDIVFAINRKLTRNQQYITYTRAMENLYIIEDR